MDYHKVWYANAIIKLIKVTILHLDLKTEKYVLSWGYKDWASMGLLGCGKKEFIALKQLCSNTILH